MHDQVMKLSSFGFKPNFGVPEQDPKSLKSIERGNVTFVYLFPGLNLMHLSSASSRGAGEPRADGGEYGDFMGTLHQISALVVGEMWGLFECPTLRENVGTSLLFN